MSIHDGLRELAAWDRANGNASDPCQDCGALPIAVWSQPVAIGTGRHARTVERRLCTRCRLRQMVEG
jgi:hypothetical protein